VASSSESWTRRHLLVFQTGTASSNAELLEALPQSARLWERRQPGQHRCLQADAFIGIGMVGGKVLFGDSLVPGFSQALPQGICDRRKSIIRGNNQHGACFHSSSELTVVPVGAMVIDFAGKAFCRAPAQRSHPLRCQVRREMRNRLRLSDLGVGGQLTPHRNPRPRSGRSPIPPDHASHYKQP